LPISSGLVGPKRMGRRRRSLEEAASKAGLTDREYVSRTMGAELKDALKASCRGIAERAKEGDQKAQYFIVEFFGRWAGPEDPRDKRAADILKRVDHIRGSGEETPPEEIEGGEPYEEAEGDWPDDSDEEGEGVRLEPNENPESWEAPVQALADVR